MLKMTRINKTTGIIILLISVFAEVGFADTDISGNTPLTLEDCIQTALKNNPEAAATQWDIAAAGFRYEQAEAGLSPLTVFEGGYNHSLDPQRLMSARYNGESGDFDRDMFRSDVIVKMPIFTGGRIVNEIAAADLLRKAEQHKLARTYDEIILNISAIFYSMLGQDKVIESLGFSIKVIQEHLKQVSELLSAQKASRLDYLRTEVRLADLKQNLVKEKNILAVQKCALSNLLGTECNAASIFIEGGLSFEPALSQSESLAIHDALTRRADYLSAKAKLEAQEKKIKIAKSAYLPQAAIQGSYGFRSDASLNVEDTGSLGVMVTMPIFDKKTAPKISEEEAVLYAARKRLKKLELQIRHDIQTAVLDLDSGMERIKSIDKSIEQARESLRIERSRYDLGAGSMTDVLDAQSALLQAETAYYNAMVNINIAHARLNWAAGINQFDKRE